jgi:3-oxoacyl-[acyl-carrier protein] reductase
MGDRVAIVTGGAKGIGAGITKKLLSSGYYVVVVGRSPKEKYENFWETIKEYKDHYIYKMHDISDTACYKEITEFTEKTFGRIDVLVNNAGVAPLERKDILYMSEDSFDRVIGNNLKGMLFMTQEVAKSMMKNSLTNDSRGVIINISSISAVVSSVDRGEYCISKAGVSMVTKLFADRLAKERILVYEVRPGIIYTDLVSRVREKYDKMLSEGVFPINRWGYPEDVAKVVAALAAGTFSYTTGQEIYVDGGYHIMRL